MIYLVGVDHRIQHDGIESANLNQRKKFIDYLVSTFKELNISIVAEEFNEDSLEYSYAKNSTAKLAVQKNDIKHIYCDPNIKERKEIKIPSEDKICKDLGIKFIRNNSEDEARIIQEKRKYYIIRENFWLDKLSDSLHKEILIIIGTDHIKSFKKLLNSKNIPCTILNNNWCFENLLT